jgi:hypothetical protein
VIKDIDMRKVVSTTGKIATLFEEDKIRREVTR